MNILKNINEKIESAQIVKIVSSSPKQKVSPKKQVLRPVNDKGSSFYMCEKFVDSKVFHVHIEREELNDYIEQLVNMYKQVNVMLVGKSINILSSNNGNITVKESKNDIKTFEALTHNKAKNYVIKEGMEIECLVDLGVFSSEYKVIKAKYDKFRQINRFVELVDDELKKEAKDDLIVVDYGCGKSYLSFVVYFYFTQVLKKRIQLFGYDLKEDVIELCNNLAKKYKYDNLQFAVKDIASNDAVKKNTDIVISLHACDIATDLSLFNAIKSNVKYIFCVPCCQHEVNLSIKSAGVMNLMLTDGLIKERFSALLTDSIRVKILRAFGYEVDVIEFVDMEHSPKNIMFRCVKKNNRIDMKAIKEIEELINETGAEQKLFSLVRNFDRN